MKYSDDIQSHQDFLSRIEPTGFCWYWRGFVNAGGYGKCFVRYGIPSQLAHRTSYALFVGSIPQGLVIDHLCRNRVCVNPDHLELVTRAENNRRGHHRLGSKDFCRREGHDMRVYGVMQTGRWRCSECERARGRRRKAAERERKTE